MRNILTVALAASLGVPAFAQDCPRAPGWNKPQRHLAARSAEMRFALKPGGSVQLSLRPQRDVRLAAPAGGNSRSRSFAGLAALEIPKGGKLEIALSNRSYVDLIRDGKALQSASHRMLAGCADVRKVVAFNVKPGRYVVQFTNAPERSVKMATVLH